MDRNLACALVLASSSCVAEVTHGPMASNGTLNLSWTINGTNDPNACHQSVADSMQLTVTDSAGSYYGNFAAPCESFAIEVDLPPGRYGGLAKLVDSRGNPRTTIVGIVPYTITTNTTLSVPIDFPAGSFE